MLKSKFLHWVDGPRVIVRVQLVNWVGDLASAPVEAARGQEGISDGHMSAAQDGGGNRGQVDFAALSCSTPNTWVRLVDV